MAGIGGFLKSKVAKKAVKTEAELLAQPTVSPDDVVALDKPCEGYLCKQTANMFGIEFVAFKLRDIEANVTLFDIAKPADAPHQAPSDDDDDSNRFVRYDFPPTFLRLKTVGATVTFCVGPKPVKKFRMVERHYFKDKLLKAFDFDFGFCIPNSTNTVEHIYEFPKLTDAEFKEMVAAPYATRSDSFYFVDGVLCLHNRADYAYNAGL